MPKPKYLTLNPIARDADGIAKSQTLTTAGAVTLDGILATEGSTAGFNIADSYGDGVAGVRIRWSSATEGITLTLTGLDQSGNSITEVLTGAAGSPAVDSVQYFSRLTSAVGSGESGAFTIGPSHNSVSRIIPLNWRAHEPAEYSIAQVDLPMRCTVQEYFNDPQSQPLATDGWFPKQAYLSTDGAVLAGTQHARAVRLALATAGGTLVFGISQN